MSLGTESALLFRSFFGFAKMKRLQKQKPKQTGSRPFPFFRVSLSLMQIFTRLLLILVTAAKRTTLNSTQQKGLISFAYTADRWQAFGDPAV